MDSLGSQSPVPDPNPTLSLVINVRAGHTSLIFMDFCSIIPCVQTRAAVPWLLHSLWKSSVLVLPLKPLNQEGKVWLSPEPLLKRPNSLFQVSPGAPQSLDERASLSSDLTRVTSRAWAKNLVRKIPFGTQQWDFGGIFFPPLCKSCLNPWKLIQWFLVFSWNSDRKSFGILYTVGRWNALPLTPYFPHLYLDLKMAFYPFQFSSLLQDLRNYNIPVTPQELLQMGLGCSSWNDVSVDPCKPGMIFWDQGRASWGKMRSNLIFLRFASLINIEEKQNVWRSREILEFLT